MSQDLERYKYSYEASDAKLRITEAIQARDVKILWAYYHGWLVTCGYSLATIKAYRPKIKRLLADTWQGVDLLRPKPKDVTKAIEALKQRGVSSSTYAVHIAAYSGFYEMLQDVTSSDDTPMLDKQPFARAHKKYQHEKSNGFKRPAYSTKDVMSLLEHAKSQNDVDMIAAVTLMGFVGLRVAELASLTWGDVKLSSGVVMVRHGKGNKSRQPTLPQFARDTLAGITGANEQAVIACVNDFETIGKRTDVIRERLQRLCVTANVEYLGCHSLRHHMATWGIKNGVPMRGIQSQLGHVSLDQTNNYIKHSEQDAFARLEI